LTAITQTILILNR